MQVRRLLKLASRLDTVPRKRFNFAEVFANGVVTNDHGCGAVGCALGWANTIPSFRKAGFQLHSTSWDAAKWLAEDFFEIPPLWVEYLFRPSYSAPRRTLHTQYPVGKLSNIDPRRYSEYLQRASQRDLEKGDFGLLPDKATPKQVAARIRSFVKRFG